MLRRVESLEWKDPPMNPERFPTELVKTNCCNGRRGLEVVRSAILERHDDLLHGFEFLQEAHCS